MRKARIIVANGNKYIADLQVKFMKKNKNIEILGIATNSQEEIELAENNDIIPKNIIKYINIPFEWNKLHIEIEKALICISYKLTEENDKLLNDYYNKKIVNLKKELNEADRKILKQIDINLKNKKYTKYEFDKIIQQLNVYCQIYKEYKYNIFKIDIQEIKQVLRKLYTIEDKII